MRQVNDRNGPAPGKPQAASHSATRKKKKEGGVAIDAPTSSTPGTVPGVDTSRCMPSSSTSSFFDWAASTLLGYDPEEAQTSHFYFGMFKKSSSSSSASQKQRKKKARILPIFNREHCDEKEGDDMPSPHSPHE
jgi:hypothetical protein